MVDIDHGCGIVLATTKGRRERAGLFSTRSEPFDRCLTRRISWNPRLFPHTWNARHSIIYDASYGGSHFPDNELRSTVPVVQPRVIIVVTFVRRRSNVTVIRKYVRKSTTRKAIVKKLCLFSENCTLDGRPKLSVGCPPPSRSPLSSYFARPITFGVLRPFSRPENAYVINNLPSRFNELFR